MNFISSQAVYFWKMRRIITCWWYIDEKSPEKDYLEHFDFSESHFSNSGIFFGIYEFLNCDIISCFFTFKFVNDSVCSFANFGNLFILIHIDSYNRIIVIKTPQSYHLMKHPRCMWTAWIERVSWKLLIQPWTKYSYTLPRCLAQESTLNSSNCLHYKEIYFLPTKQIPFRTKSLKIEFSSSFYDN